MIASSKEENKQPEVKQSEVELIDYEVLAAAPGKKEIFLLQPDEGAKAEMRVK